MRALIVFALLLAAAPAGAATYAVVCTQPCPQPDGSTQPPGTVVNRVVWDGVAPFDPGPGLVLQPDAGQPVYTPPQP